MAAAAVVVLGVVVSGPDVPESGSLEGVYAAAPYREEVHRLSSGLTLGGVLTDAGLDWSEHQRVLQAFRERFNPRRLRAGTEITIRRHADEELIERIAVGLNRDSTIFLDRGTGGGWNLAVTVLPTTVDTVYASGEITSTLWEAVMTDPVLAAMPRGDRLNFIDRLDRVFQWRVDFTRAIRVGDTYRFAFEREKRPNGSMRSGSLLAAELVNDGRPWYAIWFDPNGDGRGTWYDEEGESVRRAFLMRPIAFSRISSRFTNRRFHPVLRTWRAHRGVDYAADSGTPVEVTADGVVTRRGWNDTYGRVIDVNHANGFLTRYAHLSGFAGGIGVGTRVTQGQVIGYVGMTGLATGPHLHYEMHRRGSPLDPLSIELPADDPVPAADIDRWILESTSRLALLERLPGPATLPSVRAQD